MTSGQAVGLPDHQGARIYALAYLEEGLALDLLYHSLWHTQKEVAVRAQWLAAQEGLSSEAQLLVATAAYYHDIGFVRRRGDHENVSVQITGEILPRFGYTPKQVKLVQGMILTTRLPQNPHNILDAVVADADLDVLGRDDYFVRNHALRTELAASGVTFSDEAWYSQQLRFLQQHHYFTVTARRDRDAKKQENLQQLQALLAACCPHHANTLVASPSFAVT